MNRTSGYLRKAARPLEAADRLLEDGDTDFAASRALVKAYRTLGCFRSGAPFRPWILTVVANEARTRCRAARPYRLFFVLFLSPALPCRTPFPFEAGWPGEVVSEAVSAR